MFWATMNCTVTFEGKLRRNRKVSNELMSMGIKSIDEEMLWPDAWKMDLEICDLTPNNFNMYADYYRRGFCADEVESLADPQALSSVLDDLISYFTGDDLVKMATAGIKSAVGDLYQSGVDASKKLTNALTGMIEKTGGGEDNFEKPPAENNGKKSEAASSDDETAGWSEKDKADWREMKAAEAKEGKLNTTKPTTTTDSPKQGDIQNETKSMNDASNFKNTF